MSVRVRFAPSPTGYLHIGGARTALYCYLYAKAMKGTYVLRVEDTDQERSQREFEEAQIAELKWLGIEHDEGPDKGGEFGPYRQSERLEIYQKYAHELVEKDLAYYAFDTDEELQAMREEAEQKEAAPHYNGIYKTMDKAEANALWESGKPGVIRFRVPKKSYQFKDHVRGEVTFPEDMVGDFIILRSNGLPTYNYCCVVDDALMKMTHVIRAEDHLANTLRQLMVYEALGFDVPEFAHVSLLVGEDRQKLSKRHGATSVQQYREQGFLPEALNNYLCLLGWSHPEEKDVFDLEEAGRQFSIDRFTKAPALYDVEKLKYINSQQIKLLPPERLLKEAEAEIDQAHAFHQQAGEWKAQCLEFFKDYLTLISDINEKLPLVFEEKLSGNSEEVAEVLSWETTGTIKSYLSEQLQSQNEAGFVTAEDFSNWMNHIKKELKIKGKPLFKGIRVALTGQTEGPDLKGLIPLTPVKILLARLRN